MSIKVTEHRKLLEDMIKSHGLIFSILFIVPNVIKWVNGHTAKETSVVTIAMACPRKTRCVCDFTFINEIPDNAVEARKNLLVENGFHEEVKRLKDGASFLTYLMLHKIAHAKGIAEDHEADKWAFEKMPQAAPAQNVPGLVH